MFKKLLQIIRKGLEVEIVLKKVYESYSNCAVNKISQGFRMSKNNPKRIRISIIIAFILLVPKGVGFQPLFLFVLLAPEWNRPSVFPPIHISSFLTDIMKRIYNPKLTITFFTSVSFYTTIHKIMHDSRMRLSWFWLWDIY